jgi:Na+/H+-dicarboxylate symporter
MSVESRAALASIVGSSVERSHVEFSLRGEAEKAAPSAAQVVVSSLVPSNIFAALASGETLKALVFALLFGFAVGKVPGRMSDGLGQALETVYNACQLLTRWISLPVPVVLVCMIAAQVAESGLGPIKTMLGFVSAYIGVCTILLAMAVAVLARRAGTSFMVALDTMREPFALGVGTNNSASCMPMMIDSLVDRLVFKRAQVELLVPLSVLLFRAGAIAYFVSATLFVAAIYERSLTGSDLIVVMLFSVLSGFASTGMSGILTITMIGNACGYLGLPFEAAFILFVAVDPLCAMGRTAVTVVGSCAAVSMVCARPIRS